MDASTFEAEMHFESFLESFKPDGLESGELQTWDLPGYGPDSLADGIFSFDACADAAMSVLPGAGKTGTSRTPAQRIEAIKAKNRRAQQRYREKKKAEGKALLDNLEGLKQQIANLKLQREAKAERAQQLAERAFTASSQCSSIRCEMAGLGSQQAAALPSTPASTPPRAGPKPERAACGASGAQGCSIFSTETQYRYRETVSTSKLNCGHGSIVQAFIALQARTMERLGCSAHEISWHYESERYPEVTRGGGMAAALSETDDITRLACIFFVHMADMVSLLAVVRRLEAALKARKAGAADAGGCTGDAAPGPMQYWDHESCLPDTAPPANGPGSAHLLVCASPASMGRHLHVPDGARQPQTEHQHTIFFRHGSGPATPAAADQPPKPATQDELQVQRSSSGEQVECCITAAMPDRPCGGLAGGDWLLPWLTAGGDRAESLYRSVFPRVLQRCVRRMHPADALRMCKLLGAMFAVQPPNAGAEVEGISTIAIAVAAFNDAVHSAARSVRLNPMLPPVPANLEAIERQLQETHADLATAVVDWNIPCFLTQMCAPAKMGALMLQLNAMEFSEAEALNLQVYSLLKPDAQQQSTVAKDWAEYQRIMAGLDARKLEVARDLQLLPAATDLDLHDIYAIMRPAPTPSDIPVYASSPFAVAAPREHPLHSQNNPPLSCLDICTLSSGSALLYAPCSLQAGRMSAAGLGSAGATNRLSACTASISMQDPPSLHMAAGGWMQRLLGVSPHTTEAAALALSKLRTLQDMDNLEYTLYIERFAASLSAQQFVDMIACKMPFMPDLFRISELMASDFRRGRLLCYHMLSR